MKWFKHDSCANRDEKLEKVLLKYGADGYALYWLCLELIADRIDAANVQFELKHDAETLGARLKIDTLRVEEIMKFFIKIELFECENARITCLKLAERIENSIVKSIEVKKIQEKIRDNPGKSGKNPDNSGQRRLEERRRDKKANTDSTSLSSSEKSSRGEEAGARERADPAPAPSENSPQDRGAALLAYALKLALERKAKNPQTYAKALAKEPDVIAAFNAQADAAEKPKTRFLPDPPPCACGGKLKADIRNGFARCLGCGKAYEYDPVFDIWAEDEKQNTA